MRLREPLDIRNTIVTQDFSAHVRVALAKGWCYQPGPCPGGQYYYGGVDYGFLRNMTPEIWAAADGEVVRLYNQGVVGYGRGVQIRHPGGWTTVYAHMSETHVRVGEKVIAGQVIGLGGGTGQSTGPHLHHELRDPSGKPVDPALYLVDRTEAEVEFAIPADFREPMQVEIITTFLRIREMDSAGTTPEVGRLLQGMRAYVIRVIEHKNGDVWLQIGHRQFCAAKHDGAVYARWE